jgi:hypothetical protein
MTSQEIANNPRLNAGTRKAGDSLAKDLSGLLDTSSKIVAEANTASVEAAKRVANDSTKNYALSVQAIKDAEKEINTAQSKRDAQEQIRMAYQEYGRKTFENEDAQKVFDMNYHNPVAVNAAHEIGAFEEDAIKLDAENLRVYNLNLAGTLAKQGLLTKKKNDELIESTTKNNYVDRDGFERDLLSLQIAQFETDANNTSFTIGNVGGTDVEKYNENFVNKFEGYVTINDEGKREYLTDNVEINNAIEKSYQSGLDKADKRSDEIKSDYITEVINTSKASMYKDAPYTDETGLTHYYVPTFSAYEKRINEAFPDLINDPVSYEKIMNLYKLPDDAVGKEDTIYFDTKLYDNNNGGGSQYAPKEIKSAIDKRISYLEGISKGLTKPSNINKVKKAMDNLKEMKMRYSTADSFVDHAMKTGDYDILRQYASSEHVVNGVRIPTSFIKNRISIRSSFIESDINSLKLSWGDTKRFAQDSAYVDEKMSILYKMSEAGAVQSKYLTEIGSKFNSSALNTFKNKDEAFKATVGAKLVSSDSNNAYKILVSQVEVDNLSSILNDTSYKTETDRMNAFNKEKYSYKARRDAIINNSLSNTREVLDEYNDTLVGDTRLELSTFQWAVMNDTTVKDKTAMTKDEALKIIENNTFVYDIRNIGSGAGSYVAGGVNTLVSLVSDSRDKLVLPNRIGVYTNKENYIRNAVTGLLKSVGLNQHEVYIKTSSAGNVMFFRRDTGQRLGEINDKNIDTFSKEGAK